MTRGPEAAAIPSRGKISGAYINSAFAKDEATENGADEAIMTDWNLTWRLTQSPRVLMHVGAGVRTWTYDNETSAGVRTRPA